MTAPREPPSTPHPLRPEEDVELAPLTTLQLGGPARLLATARSEEEVLRWLRWARAEGLPLQVLGGGSNTIFDDRGFDGLVLKIESRGVRLLRDGDGFLVEAAAGEPWDDFVACCIDRDLSGLECLSGIPGRVGATPMQNVGAYGQEVSETVVEVKAVDRSTLAIRTFSGRDCAFAYRTSRFKTDDRDRFVITGVTYRLAHRKRPAIRYDELQRTLDEEGDLLSLEPGYAASSRVRQAVLALRRRKSMVVDPSDPESRSAGSFFLNPILDDAGLREVRQRWQHHAPAGGVVPVFEQGDGHKIPAAWLVEQAGFPRGTHRGGVGLSRHHALALVNRGGSTAELLAFADEIAGRVEEVFGLRLEREPVVVPFRVEGREG